MTFHPVPGQSRALPQELLLKLAVLPQPMPCMCYQQLFEEREGPKSQFKKTLSDVEKSPLSFYFIGKAERKHPS